MLKEDLVNQETTQTKSTISTSNSSPSALFQPPGPKKIGEIYMCPKCQVQIDSNKITLKKVESHMRKCDLSKLVCIFCLKLYEKSEQVLFENHVQKHLIKQALERSPTTTTTTVLASTLNRVDTTIENQQAAQHANSTILLNDSSDTSASNNSNFD